MFCGVLQSNTAYVITGTIGYRISERAEIRLLRKSIKVVKSKNTTPGNSEAFGSRNAAAKTADEIDLTVFRY